MTPNPKRATVEDYNSDSDRATSRPKSQPKSKTLSKKPPPTASHSKMPATRVPSNHSDSGYSSKTGATVNSTNSSKSSGKKPEKRPESLRLDTTPKTLRSLSASIDGKKASSTVAQHGSTSAKLAPRNKKPDSSDHHACTDPNCRGRSSAAATAPSPAITSWAPGYYYPPTTSIPLPYASGAPSPSPQASFPPPSYNYPSTAPTARGRRRSISTSAYGPPSYQLGTPQPGSWPEVSSEDPRGGQGPPPSISAYGTVQPMPTTYRRGVSTQAVPQHLLSGVNEYLPSASSSQHIQRPTLPYRPTTGSIRPASVYERLPSDTVESASIVYDHRPTYQAFNPNRRGNTYAAEDFDNIEPYAYGSAPVPIQQAQALAQSAPPRSSLRRYMEVAPADSTHAVPPELALSEFDGDRTIRPKRRGSLQRPNILKSSSFQASSDTTSNRPFVTSTSSRYDPRAERVRRETSEAEAYMAATDTAGQDGRMRRQGQEVVTSQALQKRGEAITGQSGQEQRRHNRGTSTAHSRRRSSRDEGAPSQVSTSTSGSGALKLSISGLDGVRMELSGPMDGKTIRFGRHDGGNDIQEVTIGSSSPTSTKDLETKRRSERSSRSGASYSERAARSSVIADQSGRNS